MCLFLGHLEIRLSTSYRDEWKPSSVTTTGFHGNPAVCLPRGRVEIWLSSGSVLAMGSIETQLFAGCMELWAQTG